MLQRLLLAALAGALGVAATGTRRRPAGFNDPGHDPRAIMRGAGNYHHVLKAHGVKPGRGYERLKPLRAGHKHLPHVHDFFNFTGTTDGGFLDMRHNAVVRNTTINSDDYLELLTSPGVAIDCAAVGAAPAFAPLPAGTAPYYDADNTLVRNNVVIRLSLPAALSPATAPALEHLRERLAAAAAGEHTSIAFGFELMATHSSFAASSACAAQVPYSTPYFAVALASGLDSASRIWTLTLTPATPMDLFLSMDTDINFDPNVERAHSRRLSAGLHLGADVRSDSARRLFTATLDRSSGVNWNSQLAPNAAALQDKIEMLPTPGMLVCKNCFAYYAVSFSVSFRFCVSYYAYGQYARDTTYNPYSTDLYSPQRFPDCAALGTQQANANAQDRSSVNFNFGVDVSAQFTGEAGFNIQFTSAGFSGQRVVPQFNLLSTGSLAPMSFGSSFTFSIVPVLGLDAAANISASLPPFSMGASASAQVGLGGSMSLPSLWTGSMANYVTNYPTYNTYRTLTTSFTSQPFTIDQSASLTSAWGGSASIALIPWYQLRLFSLLPIKASPVFTVGASMWTEGTLPPSRLLREDGVRRQLAGGCITATANANSGLSIGIGATRVVDLLPAISTLLTSIVPSELANVAVTSAATLYSVPSIGSPFSISTPPCPTPSPTPSRTPTPTPSASRSFGAAVLSAGAPAEAAAPAGAALGTDSIVSIAVGAAVVLVVLCSALVCLPRLLRGAAVAKAFGEPGPAVLGSPNPMHVAAAQQQQQQEEQMAHLRAELAAALALMQQQQGAAQAGAQRALEAQQQVLAQQQAMQRQLQEMAAAAAAAAAAPHVHAPSTHHHPAPHGSASPAVEVRVAPAASAAATAATAAAAPAFDEAAVRRYAKEQFDEDELPPGFDWEADNDGRVLYTLPNGTKTPKDPRHNWAGYLEAFMTEARTKTAAGRRPKWA
jgi:hypothetical protein